MTRFARATGSKGSNDKRPEEASSWQEMKAAMISKTIKPNTAVRGEDVDVEIPSSNEIQSVWADLVAETKVKAQKRTSDDKSRGGASNKAKIKKGERKIERDTQLVAISPVKPSKLKKRQREIKDSNDGGNIVDEGLREKKAKSFSTTTMISGREDTRKKKKKNMGTPVEDTFLRKKGKQNKGVKEIEKLNANSIETGHSEPAKTMQKPREKKRRKEALKASEVIINGKPVQVTPFDGFIVQADDAARLRELRQNMIAQKIPEDERERAIKLERRRAEKCLARLKKRVCFHCRGSGHNLSECPEVEEDQRATGICFKCGSTEHTLFQCKVTRGEDFRFAECFICREQGHIAKQCPDNPRGLYPRGGACAACGDVTHLKKDCPKYLAEKEEDTVTVATSNNRALEALEEELQMQKPTPINTKKKLNKHIKF